jgi:hypothetical protein
VPGELAVHVRQLRQLVVEDAHVPGSGEPAPIRTQVEILVKAIPARNPARRSPVRPASPRSHARITERVSDVPRRFGVSGTPSPGRGATPNATGASSRAVGDRALRQWSRSEPETRARARNGYLSRAAPFVPTSVRQRRRRGRVSGIQMPRVNSSQNLTRPFMDWVGIHMTTLRSRLQ